MLRSRGFEKRISEGVYMVDHGEGQFYTMEGIAAAILMVITAYLVLGATSVYTPGDTHIIDMQLEQLGNDALKIMDTKNNMSVEAKSDLERYIYENNSTGFSSAFNNLINPNAEDSNPIQFRADVYYINNTGYVNSTRFAESTQKFSGNENAVISSRWAFIEKSSTSLNTDYNTGRTQTVLIEVMLWRG